MRSGSTLVWAVWIGAAAVAAAGLSRYRVDNAITDWAPETATVGPFASYCVVGWPKASVDGAAIADALRALPTVAMCIDARSVNAFGPLHGVTADNFVVGPDGRWAGAFCFPASGVSDAAFVDEIRKCMRREANDRAVLAGPAVFHVELNAWSQRRLPAIVAAITLLGAVLLTWITGNVGSALAGTTAVVVSQIVLVGGIAWLGIPMDMSLSVVPPMMLALGFSYVAHRAVQSHIIATLAMCAATTAAGVGVFAATDLLPIRRFALFGVVGVLLVWLAVVTLVRPPIARQKRRRHARLRIRNTLLSAVCRHPRKVIAVFAMLTFAALPAAFRVRFASDPLDYFPADAPIVRHFKTLDEHLTGMLPFQVTVSGNCDIAVMFAETPGVRKVIDVSAWVGSHDRVYWCLADNSAMPALEAAQHRWRQFADAHNCRLAWTGVAAQLARTATVIRRVALLSLPLMVLFAGVVIGLVTRSVRLALLSAWVNAIPALFLIVLAGVSRWPLDLPALMIGAIAIGMAIDDTIHVVRAVSRNESIRRTLLRCWRPCAGSTFVAASCLLLFALAPFRPTAQFGVLLALASLAALAGDLLLLPAAMSTRAQAR